MLSDYGIIFKIESAIHHNISQGKMQNDNTAEIINANLLIKYKRMSEFQ